MRYFNIAGPCDPSRHYMLPAEARLPGLDRLIDRGAFFVVHAPRQTGKTTAMQALARRLTAEGRYTALYLSCENARSFPEDVAATERVIWSAVEELAPDALPAALQPPPRRDADPGTFLRAQLTAWARACPRPLVLVFDEIDAVEGEPLKSVLSQLREGHNSRRNTPFPHSVVLCGVRDVRDYKAASGGSPVRLGSSSPFNIKEKSWRLGDFDEAGVAALYAQHTEATGQRFTEEALRRAWVLTRGQPWLVNALARAIVDKMQVPVGEPITAAHLDAAKQWLILERQTHLDSLLARLREPRVQRILEPVIAGTLIESESFDDDFQYVVDLGLVAPTRPATIANPIYREVILRVLASVVEANITARPRDYLLPDGRLDMGALLEGFRRFWLQHGGILASGLGYQEAAPHLVLMAWLHRLVNGGGYVEREVGVGSGRIDVLVRWPWTDADGHRQWQREAIEIKAWRDRDKRGDPTRTGLDQLDQYLEKLGLETGFLAVFDDRSGAPEIEERTSIAQVTTPKGRGVTVFRG